jgi:hypothetical protein
MEGEHAFTGYSLKNRRYYTVVLAVRWLSQRMNDTSSRVARHLDKQRKLDL